MKHTHFWMAITSFFLLFLSLSSSVYSAPGQGQPSAQQRAAMLKQWLKASQAQIRKYEWVETTVVSKDGDEKNRMQKHCYYDARGSLQKVLINQKKAESKHMPGLLPFGRMANRALENKKEEVTDYMKSAVALVKKYVPTRPDLIQRSINAGKLGMQMIVPNRHVRLTFGDYYKEGDKVSIDIELPTNRLMSIAVNSYLSSPDDAISLDVHMGLMPDGTIYAAKTNLHALSKGIKVAVDNSGHRLVAR